MATHNVIIITGEIGAGKTTFLSELIPALQKKWSVDGFTCLSEESKRSIGNNSCNYKLRFIGQSRLFQWATRKKTEKGYNLNDQTRAKVHQRLANSDKEILILDDLGPYEIRGEGFASLFTQLLSQQHTLIIVVKKRVLDKFQKQFNFTPLAIINIEQGQHEYARKQVIRQLHLIDSEKAGLFATIAGAMEVTVGSALHATHLPLKGHILTLLQTFLLIQFAKELKGRSLFLISAISAGIKSFSPTGTKLKPMFYIFIQGVLFATPISIIGVNYISIIIGSLLLGVSTIYLSLLLNYMIYGPAYITSIENMLHLSLKFLHLHQVPFWQLIFWGSIIKALLVVFLATIAYYFDFTTLLNKGKAKLVTSPHNPQQYRIPTTKSWKAATIQAIKDLSLKRFMIPFILTALVIYFFAHLSWQDFSFVIIRALLISWFGFTLANRINFLAIEQLLKKRGLDHWAKVLNQTVTAIERLRR